MDQCCGVDGTKSTVDIILQISGFDDDAVTYSMLNEVFQALVVREVSFLDGASLMESVCECVFMWQSSWPVLDGAGTTKKSVLVQYCRALSRSQSHVFTSVLAADIYEGECCGVGVNVVSWCVQRRTSKARSAISCGSRPTPPPTSLGSTMC